MDDQCIKSRKTLRKERQKARHDKLHKIKYGYVINKMHPELREKNIRMWNDNGIVEYDSYDEAVHYKNFDSINFISFQHYVLGMNMKYPSDLRSLSWSFQGNRWYDIGQNEVKKMELCDATNDTYELPILPNTVIRLYIHSIILKPIKILPNTLTILEISYSNLTSLPELPETLIELSCISSELVELPKLPDKLKRLTCFWNNITYLPELPNTLECLICGSTIRKMPNSIVNLKGNNIKNRIELEKIFKWKKEVYDLIENQCKFDFVEFLKYQSAVETISNQYLKAKYNPKYKLCRDRLEKEYIEMYQEE